MMKASMLRGSTVVSVMLCKIKNYDELQYACTVAKNVGGKLLVFNIHMCQHIFYYA
jgi:hypothetical protein